MVTCTLVLTSLILTKNQEKGRGILYGKELKAEADPEKRAALSEEKKKEYNDLFCNPYQAARMGYIEDIIEPRNTRFRIIRALEATAGKKQELPAKKHDNLPL